MVGEYEIIVDSEYYCYNISVKRQYTVICGFSGSGKTLFAQAIEDSGRELNGVTLKCEVPVVVMNSFRGYLNIGFDKRTIYVIDEAACAEISGNEKLSMMFAKHAKKADCYFIFMSRTPIGFIQYSVEEIYQFVHDDIGNKRFIHFDTAYENKEVCAIK